MKQNISNYIFCIFKNDHTNYTMSEFNIDFKSNKTTHTFLRKGQGKRMSNLKSHINHEYLKKGEGKLASNFQGETKFAEKRKQQIVDEQFERERKYYEELEKNHNSDEE